MIDATTEQDAPPADHTPEPTRRTLLRTLASAVMGAAVLVVVAACGGDGDDDDEDD